MTIDEAIVGLEDLQVADPHFEPERRIEAIKLGIEALKAIDDIRKHHHLYTAALLPGETKD